MKLFYVIWIPVFLLLLQAQSCPAFNYKHYNINVDGICPSFSKAEYPTLIHGQGLTFTEQVPVRTPAGWDGYNCRWSTHHLDGESTGIIVVIQRLNLRRKPNTAPREHACQDYIICETAYNVWVQETTICGSILFGMYTDDKGSLLHPPSKPLPPGPPDAVQEMPAKDQQFKLGTSPWDSIITIGAFINPEGKFSTELHISTPVPEENGKLEVVIAHTPYSECNGTDVEADRHSTLFHCGHGLCISNIYVNDGIVNCPFGDCADETNCSVALAINFPGGIPLVVHKTAISSSENTVIVSGNSTYLSTSTTILIIIMLIKICIGIFYLLYRHLPRCCQMFASGAVRLQNEEDEPRTTQPTGSIYPGQIVIIPPSVQGQPTYPQGQTSYPQGSASFHQGHVN